MKAGIIGVGLLIALAAGSATAQDAPAPPIVGMVDHPCVDLPPKPPSLLALEEAMIRPGPLDLPAMIALTQQADYVAYAAAKAARDAQDWAGLCVYRDANAALRASGVQPDVVLMGDSITENWARAEPALFERQHIVGRGISGQTSGQMLVRFRADVIDLHPRLVHLMVGTNDVAGNGGPTSPDAFKSNIRSMVELAQANGVQVVLGAIPPADRFFWQAAVRPADRIVELNAWLEAYARQKGIVFIDYHAALDDGHGGISSALSLDGVHPNRDAYAIMNALLAAGK